MYNSNVNGHFNANYLSNKWGVATLRKVWAHELLKVEVS